MLDAAQLLQGLKVAIRLYLEEIVEFGSGPSIKSRTSHGNTGRQASGSGIGRISIFTADANVCMTNLALAQQLIVHSTSQDMLMFLYQAL